jgi:NACHT domain-containing protein
MTTNRQFSLALEALSELKLQTDRTAHAQPAVTTSNRSGVLAAIGPLPHEALFLGIASDGLPVLLNLHDPHPGPMLIIGEAGSGKTAFLHSIARSVVQTHPGSEVQFAVITNRVAEWDGLEKSSHLVGIFDVTQAAAKELILSLASWAHSNKNTQQSVLLLIDDLESIAKMDFDALQNLRWLLLRGPVRRVWPLITLNAERYGQVLAWIEIFRTRVFGRIQNGRVADALGGDRSSALDQLEVGRQFSLRENGNWLRFSLPSF